MTALPLNDSKKIEQDGQDYADNGQRKESKIVILSNGDSSKDGMVVRKAGVPTTEV